MGRRSEPLFALRAVSFLFCLDPTYIILLAALTNLNHVFTPDHICTCVSMCVYMYVCVSMCVSVCVCECVCVCLSTRTGTVYK